MSEGEDLPPGWVSATLATLAAPGRGALAIGPFGSSLKVSDYRESGVPLVFVRDIRAESFGGAGTRHVSSEKAEELRAHWTRAGDLLITKMGDPPGDTAVYPSDRPAAVVTADCIKMTVGPASSAAFLKNWLRAGRMRDALLEETAGVAQQKLSLERFRTISVPVPPLAEQRRIVAKLEALLARSKRAKEALDAIPPLLETLRRSILAAAFRGDLTEDWREKHPDVEPADRLLARIRVERRKKWEEAELARLRAKGKAPTDDRWKEKYREPEPVDTSGLPELPEGWAWASLEELTDADRGIPYGIVLTGEETADGTPTVRCGDIKAFSIEAASLKRVSKAIVAEYQRTRLVGGEVLIAIRGTVGATAVASPEMEGMNISREVAMIPVLRGQDSRNLMFCLASPQAQSRLMKHVKGVAQSGINLSDLRTLPVPVAPMSEQQALNAAIDGALAKVAGLGRLCVQATDRETLLVASVLGAAFRGELVPQDPNDEPADVMLARLAAEQAAPASAAKPSRGKADPKTPARKTRLR